MKRIFVFCILGIVILSGLYFIFHERRGHVLEIYIFNLKSGNSIFVRTPNDKRFIFGSGSSKEILRYITRILPFYNDSIDTAIIDDLQDKNILLFPELIERFNISKLLLPDIHSIPLNISTSSYIYDFIKKNTEIYNPSIEYIKSGDQIFGEDDLDIMTLFPTINNDFIYSKSSPPNISWKITYKDINVYILGKTTKKIQKYIASHIATSSQKYNILITYTNDRNSNISRELIQKINMTEMIYSANNSLKKSTDSINVNKKNIRDYDYIKIIIDGYRADIKGIR